MINGKSMIQRVVEQARRASRLDAVIVATDDERIYTHVLEFGARAVLTSADHESGTDRCLEAALSLEGPIDVVINIQGDEPFIQPEQIDAVASLIEDGAEIATLAIPIPYAVSADPNKVKVVIDRHGKALYFSRSPIPHYREGFPENATCLKHLGLYGYRFEVLRQIAQMKPGFLEGVERLEQLRWLENGLGIFVGLTDYESPAIDTPEDLRKLIASL